METPRWVWPLATGALLAGAVAVAATALILGDAVWTYHARGDTGGVVMAVAFLPVYYFVWPWQHAIHGYPLWIAFVASLVGYVGYGLGRDATDLYI